MLKNGGAHTITQTFIYSVFANSFLKKFIGFVKVSDWLPNREVFFADLCSMLLIF